MPVLPNLVIENGLSSLGVLSALYLKKKNQGFFAGIFEKNRTLFLVINIKENTYISLQVSQQQIENLLRGNITFWKLIYQSDKLEIIKEQSSSIKTPSKAYSTISTLYMESMNRIFSVPNVYYYWNEFQYSQRR
jgi:hypothetical protein